MRVSFSIGMSFVMLERGLGLSSYIVRHRSCLQRHHFTLEVSRLVHKFVFSYSLDRGQEDNSAPSQCSG
jgi:hypothetical protein